MQIKRTNFPSILEDNEETYLQYLEAVINSIDFHSSTEVTNKPDGFLIRIAPSDPLYLSVLLDTIKIAHNNLFITVEFSKSIKTGNTITFQIKK